MSEEFLVDNKRTVDSYLNAISYDVPLAYRPHLFSLGFANFIKLVNGDQGEEHNTPLMHYYMLDTLMQGENRVANLCHRGSAKTTVMGEYFILYLALYGHLEGFGKINLGIYVSDSIENGVKNMRKNLEHRWSSSDFLREYIPTAKFTDVRWEFTNADGLKFIMKGYGAQTGVRGAKELGVRPQLAILDDLISDEDARSATVISSVEDTVGKAVNFALHPTNNLVIWSGTPFNARDPLYKAVESGAWAVNVFPICEHFPCEEKDFKGSWPDRFPYSYVKKEYERSMLSGTPDHFNQELMLRIMSDEDRLIPDNCIKWYRHASVLDAKSNFNFYITTDFATTARKSGDLSVISVWAYDNAGNWYWVDGICRRQPMDQNINYLFQFVSMYHPQSVGIEVSGQQGGFIPWIQQEMMNRNTYFSMASDSNKSEPGIRPTTDKMARFNIVVPIIKAGKLFFPHEKKGSIELVEAVNELSLVTHKEMKSKNDDFLDTISMLPLMKPWKPSSVSPMRLGEDAIWQDADVHDESSGLESYIY